MNNSFKQHGLALLTIFFVLFAIGCGGSTRGTGGVTVEGRVSKADGSGQSGVDVTILQTGDMTATDENGSYSLRSVELAVIDLLLEKNDFSAQVNIPNIPSDTARIIADIEIDIERNQAQAIKVTTEKKKKDEKSDSDSSSEDSSGDSNDAQEDLKDDFNEDSEDELNEDDKQDDSPSSGGSSSGEDSKESEDDLEDEESSNSGSGSSSSSAEDEEEEEEGGEGESNQSGCEDQDKEGPIESIGGNSITVGGVTFGLNAETEIKGEEDLVIGDLTVGQAVRVKGDCTGNQLIAKEIRLEDED